MDHLDFMCLMLQFILMMCVCAGLVVCSQDFINYQELSHTATFAIEVAFGVISLTVSRLLLKLIIWYAERNQEHD